MTPGYLVLRVMAFGEASLTASASRTDISTDFSSGVHCRRRSTTIRATARMPPPRLRSIGPISDEARKLLPIWRGTESSNPSPSSEESAANSVQTLPPNRERECLVKERTRLVNRMKGTLARLGIRNFKPTLRQAAERLATLDTPEGTPVPPNALAELQRDLSRLGFVVGQIKQIEKVSSS